MRYQIWNGTDNIITPSGTQFTASEWADRYPWVKLPGARMIITAGLINGGASMEYGATVEHYRKSGAASGGRDGHGLRRGSRLAHTKVI